MSDNPLQRLVNTMNDLDRGTRAQYHMTLGKLIEVIKPLNPDLPYRLDRGGTFYEGHSYRGYYSDLAFEPTDEQHTLGSLMSDIQSFHNKPLEGYKGGDFVMHDNVPIWISNYGQSSGIALMRPVLIHPEYVEFTTLETHE